ncbi:MAG: hypothetical protein KAQ92_08125, partial [Candidatus Aenigmarchaeota archaeon]|nr:hypothetical protein [Candidatus Aenigmarchaeota archaeon]
IREASIVYKYDINPYIMIPVGGYSHYIYPEQEAVAVLVPKFDSIGNLVQPSANKTTFKAVAFSLLPKYYISWNDYDDEDTFVLLETNAEFDLDVKISDPFERTEDLPIDWSSGESYIVGDNFRPASMVNLNNKAFKVEDDIVNFAFVPHEGYVYFPSWYGYKTVDDSQYIRSCKFRNYRG